MTNEDLAPQLVRESADTPGTDWQHNLQEPNATANREVTSDSPTTSESPTETSVLQLSAVLIITLGGMAITFALGAIILLLATRG